MIIYCCKGQYNIKMCMGIFFLLKDTYHRLEYDGPSGMVVKNVFIHKHNFFL